ncbi:MULTISPECIES: DUF5666 domain-containing protein [Aeromicrobium]|uniref:DUF5666 domain-containing protein n=1 Tax=Aeromicrobium TaxID=2040 RepID=UPI0025798C69|nr:MULTISPECIES: DUF5666 domain-containing protein [Aeromicrobium]
MTGATMKRTFALTATALTLAFSVAACGGAASDTQAASSEQQQSQQEGGGGRPGGQPGSGKVAAVDGSTAQVQGSSSQTAVTWTDSTTFTRQVSGSLEDVTKGSCVVVTGGGSSDAVTATSVRVTQQADGECADGFGSGGPGGGERPTDRPSGAPEGQEPPSAPQGERPGGAKGGGMTAGEVTAVSGSGFTVASSTPGSDETSDVKVTVGDDTTYTTTAKADADDVKVGVCLQTRGETDSTGAVKATSIQISTAADGKCVTRGSGRRDDAPADDSTQQDEGEAA